MKVKEFQEKYFAGLTPDQIWCRLFFLYQLDEEKIKMLSNMYHDFHSMTIDDFKEEIDNQTNNCIDWKAKQ